MSAETCIVLLIGFSVFAVGFGFGLDRLVKGYGRRGLRSEG